MLRKITCNRTRKLKAIKEKVSLYSNQITFSYNQWLHLGSTQYKQFPQKKKMEGVCAEEKEKGRMRRGRKEERKKERMKGMRRKGKRWKRGEEEKGWKEFVRKEREKGE